MNLPFFLALRYLKGSNKFLLNFWSTFSVLGIFFGVFSILVASSFMDGLKQVMIEELLQKRAHITIEAKNKVAFEQAVFDLLEKEPQVLDFSQVVYTQGLLKAGQISKGVLVCGIDLDKQKKILPFLQDLSVDKLSDRQIVLSENLAVEANLFNEDFAFLYSTQNMQKTAFGKVPVGAKFALVSCYKADNQILSDNLAYVSVAAAQKIAGESANAQLEIHLKDAYAVEEVLNSLEQNLGSAYRITGWNQEDKAIYDSLRVEAMALNLVLFLIIVLAIFNMSGNFLRLVNEKSGEIGVLKAMGLNQNQIKKIFVYCSVCIAGLGSGAGIVLAYAFLHLQHSYRWLAVPVQGLGFDYLPVEVSYASGVYLLGLVLLVSLIFSYYPCRRLQSVDPIKVIKE